MAEIKEALVPDIGDYSDIPVIEVLVAVGDTVKKDQGLVTLESDKATMEVPSSVAGVVKEIKVKIGDNLSEGKVVALIEVAEGEAKPAAAAKTEAAETATKVEPVAAPAQPDKLAAREIEQAAAKPTQPAPAAAAPSAGAPTSPPVQFNADSVLPQKVPYASPAVRVFARELGVDLNQLSGTEKGGRITKGDVQKFVKSALTGGVAASGGTAYQRFMARIAPALPATGGAPVVWSLPSTSPANAAWPLPRLQAAWQPLADALQG